MDIHIVRDEAGLDLLATEWNSLLPGAVSDVPFLRHEYITTWWSTLGGGEWPAGELCTVVGRGQGGRLVGAAPLFRTLTPGGAPALRFIGSREISDYLDLIVGPEALASFVEEVLTVLETEAWESLELDNVLEGSPTLPVVEAAARRRGWATTRQRLKSAPVAGLEGGWEAYLSRLDRKNRHELRRKMRKIESHPAGIEVRWTRPTQEGAAEVDIFLDLMTHDPAKARFLTPRMREYFRRLAFTGGTHGWLELALMYVGGTPAAGYLIFAYRNRLWIYNSGLDPAFLALSPGWVLLGRVIEAAANAGMEAVDFLRGEETYKIQLGGVPRYLERLQVQRVNRGQ